MNKEIEEILKRMKANSDAYLKQLQAVNDQVSTTLTKYATTEADRKTQDDALKNAEAELKKADDFIKQGQEDIKKLKISDEDMKKGLAGFNELRFKIKVQQDQIKDVTGKIGKARAESKGDDAGKKLEKDAVDAGTTFASSFKSFVDSVPAYFTASEKTPEQLKEEQEKKEKDEKESKGGGLFDKLASVDGKSLIGGIIGGLIGFMGGRMFGGGLIGKFIQFGLAIIGFLIGSQKLGKLFGGKGKVLDNGTSSKDDHSLGQSNTVGQSQDLSNGQTLDNHQQTVDNTQKVVLDEATKAYMKAQNPKKDLIQDHNPADSFPSQQLPRHRRNGLQMQ